MEQQQTSSSEQTSINFDEQEEKDLQEQLTKTKLVDAGQQRMAFNILLTTAMLYRNKYFDKDMDDMRASAPPHVDEFRTKGKKQIKVKTVKNLHRASVEATEQRMRFFNKRAVEEINNTRTQMKANTLQSFDGMIGYAMSCFEEILSAPRHDEVLTLLQLYNTGKLDGMFAESRKQKVEKLALPPEEKVEAPSEHEANEDKPHFNKGHYDPSLS